MDASEELYSVATSQCSHWLSVNPVVRNGHHFIESIFPFVEKLGETQFQPAGFLKMYLIPNSNIMANSPYTIILPTDESHDKSEDEYKVRI